MLCAADKMHITRNISKLCVLHRPTFSRTWHARCGTGYHMISLSHHITERTFTACYYSTVCVCLRLFIPMYKVENIGISLRNGHSNRLAPSRIEISCLTSIICSYKELHFEAISCLRAALRRRAARLHEGRYCSLWYNLSGLNAHSHWLSSWWCL